MSSHEFVSSTRKHWTAATSAGGAAIWAAIASLAGWHRIHVGIIELLLLFAPLVIVPLGLELTRMLGNPTAPALDPVLRLSQVVATIGVCMAMLLPPGHSTAFLSALWFVYCGLLAGSRIVRWQSRKPTLSSLMLDLAHADLALGAAWLVISRAGLRPMGFQEPIILLTAVHFHYSGFGTAIIAAATLQWFQKRSRQLRFLRLLLLCVVLLPFAVAAGFVFSPVLRFAAAMALASCVTVLGVILLGVAPDLRNVHARLHLRLAACAMTAALALSGAYALSEYFGKGWITVPLMANTHGVLNSLGFVLLALLAWLIELHTVDTAGTVRQDKDDPEPIRWKDAVRPAGSGRGSPGAHPELIPEFVARDFYDR
jgi:YndJ-like protein